VGGEHVHSRATPASLQKEIRIKGEEKTEGKKQHMNKQREKTEHDYSLAGPLRLQKDVADM
jgi:hypothetical protein